MNIITFLAAGALLSGTVLQYAMPDVQCVADYLELWQHPTISDVILLETVLTHVRPLASFPGPTSQLIG